MHDDFLFARAMCFVHLKLHICGNRDIATKRATFKLQQQKNLYERYQTLLQFVFAC